MLFLFSLCRNATSFSFGRGRQGRTGGQKHLDLNFFWGWRRKYKTIYCSSNRPTSSSTRVGFWLLFICSSTIIRNPIIDFCYCNNLFSFLLFYRGPGIEYG